MMFQCGVTILDADTYFQTKIPHNTLLRNANIALVHCQGQHYIPETEVIDPTYSYCALMVINSISMGEVGAPVVRNGAPMVCC